MQRKLERLLIVVLSIGFILLLGTVLGFWRPNTQIVKNFYQLPDTVPAQAVPDRQLDTVPQIKF